MLELTLQEELTIYSRGLEPHSRYKGHVICKDVHDWAIMEPNGNIEYDIHSLAVARAWVNAGEDYE